MRESRDNIRAEAHTSTTETRSVVCGVRHAYNPATFGYSSPVKGHDSGDHTRDEALGTLSLAFSNSDTRPASELKSRDICDRITKENVSVVGDSQDQVVVYTQQILSMDAGLHSPIACSSTNVIFVVCILAEGGVSSRRLLKHYSIPTLHVVTVGTRSTCIRKRRAARE